MLLWGKSWISILAVLMIESCFLVECARKVDVKKRFAEGMINYSSWRQRRDAGASEPEPNSDELLGLETGEHLKGVTSITTAAGTTMEKLVETYDGVPVFSQAVVMETDESGEPTGKISGHLVEGIHEDIPDTDPELSEHDALSLAAESMGDSVEDIAPGSFEILLEVYIEDQPNSDEVMSFLAYSLSYLIIRDGEPTRPSFIMDANSGRIVRSWEGLTSRVMPDNMEDSGYYDFSAVGGNRKMGRNTYGDRFPALQIRTIDGICYLENDKVAVVDATSYYQYYYYSYDNTDNSTEQALHHAGATDDDYDLSTFDIGNDTFNFPCEQGFNDSVNGAYSPMADAFFYGIMTYDLFMEWLGAQPLSFKIVLEVHVGNQMENAFWDGQRTHFGDGRSTFYPLTVLDIVAHEVAHGFTEQNSGLIYAGQSGGMNEAFSDISGGAAEEYMKMTEWINGEDAFKEEGGLRYFIDPTIDGSSIGDAEQFCSSMDVHHSSGVFNRAFYLLSTTEGWTIRMAFQVFAVANQLYWTPDSTFDAGACGVVQAAADLGFNQEDVVNAFQQVGVAGCDARPEGLDSLHGLHALENETLTFVFRQDDENINILRFETYTSNYWSGDWTLHVQTPERNLSTEIPDDTIHVLNPPTGNYIVSMTPTADSFNGADLYAITGQTVLAENLQFENFTHIMWGWEIPFHRANGSFFLPEAVVTAGLPVAIRTHNYNSDEVGHYWPLEFKISYEDEVDFAQGRGQISGCLRYNNKKQITEAFIRNPREGVYNFQVAGDIDWTTTEGFQLIMERLLLPEFPQ